MSDTNTHVIKYDIDTARIAEMRQEYMALTVRDYDDKEGYEKVVAARKEIKARRGDVEKQRVALKADALEYGRKVDSIAKALTKELLDIETHLEQQEAIVKNELERKKNEAARLEKERTLKRQRQLAEVGFFVAEEDLRTIPEESFVTILAQKTQLFVDEQERQRKRNEEFEQLRKDREEFEKKRLEAEATAKKLQDELNERNRQEIARLEAEAAEKERVEAARRAEEERKLEEERAAKQAEIDARNAEIARLEAEAAEKERLNAQKIAEEERARQAKEEEERSLKEKEEQERLQRELEARRAAANEELYNQIKIEFPSLEQAWGEVVRLRILLNQLVGEERRE